MKWVSIFLFGFALHPALGLVMGSFVGPARVVIFGAGWLAAGAGSTSLRRTQVLSRGSILVGAFLLVVVLVVFKTASERRLSMGAVSNVASYLVVTTLALLTTDSAFEKVIGNIRTSLAIAGIATAVWVATVAVESHQFLVGLLRYSEYGFNLNEYGVYSGLAVVTVAGSARLRRRGGRLAWRASMAILALATLMLFSRTTILAVVLTFAIVAASAHYRLITPSFAITLGLILIGLINFGSIYDRWGPMLDQVMSGRGWLWLHASNGGHFQLISSLFEDDAVVRLRTTGIGRDPTSYVHSTLLYMLLNIGIIGTVILYTLVMHVIYANLKESEPSRIWALAIVVYLILAGLAEQPLEFQKFGALFWFFLTFLASIQHKRMESEPMLNGRIEQGA